MILRRILTAIFTGFMFCANASGQNVETRPGKGLVIFPGDFIEFTNTMIDGDNTKSLPSTIMVALEKQGDKMLVQVFSVEKEVVVSKNLVQYDLTKEKLSRGKLVATGKEELQINGRKYKCTWEKRKDRGTTATFWLCPDLPFERFVKVQMESESGQKMISKVVLHGPRLLAEEKSKAFINRLFKLLEQNEKTEQNGAGNPLPAPETKSPDKKTSTKKSDGRSQ